MNKNLWFARAKELGIEGLEISQSLNRSRELSWFDQKVDSFVTSKVISTSIRALVNGKIVSISLEKVDDDMIDEVLNNLVVQSENVSDTEKDILIPVMDTDETLSARNWIRPSMDEIRKVLSSLEEKLLKADPRVVQVNAIEWADSESGRDLRNSLGVNVSDSSRAQTLFAQITMKDGDEIRDGYEIEIVENLADFNEDAFVKRLVDKVAGTLHARSLNSRTCPVIFNKDAMTTLFSCFESSFYGSTISKGISMLTGKLGEKIWSDKITVIDDPRNQDSIYLRNYDDEGHPTFTKIVVDHGVFSTILHNSRSAIKMDAESTGNGYRSGGGSTDVSSLNLYIVPGKDSLKELEERMGNGVEITELAGMHAGVDPVSGNFSLQARGWLIEHGEKVRPLTLITVAGNFNDLMNHVEAVGNDLDWTYHSTVCPSILFSECAIAGSED